MIYSVLLGVPPLGVYNHNTEGENGDFQPLHPKISRNSQTVSIAATVILLTINWKFALDFFAMGLHTRTAVARLPLRQLGFLVNCRDYSFGIQLTAAKTRTVIRLMFFDDFDHCLKFDTYVS